MILHARGARTTARSIAASVLLAVSCVRSGTAPAGAPEYAVGTSSALHLDANRRVGPDSAPRPLQITVWFPARATAQPPVTFGDYFDLAQAERGAPADSTVRRVREEFAASLRGIGVGDTAVARWLATPMRAVRDASPAAGRFPLVVIAQGNGQSAGDQALLAEYLAASGYVVVTSPSYTRISGPPTSEDDLGRGAEEQADDIAFLVSAARRRADVDPRRFGIVAHSLGARGALLFMMRTRSPGALVSLDGGIGTATGLGAMQRAPSYVGGHLAAPVLHFYETLDAFMKPDTSLFASLHRADVTRTRMDFMHHHHFTDLGQWVAQVPGLLEATGGFSRTAESHAAMMRATRAFLDKTLRH